jgi:hypothetical protein
VESCTVETGLLRKTPCGHTAVAKCANCEQPLCTKHAIAQLNEAQKKTGKFLCAECNAADRRFQASAPVAATPAAKPAAPPAKPAAAPPAKPPAGAAAPGASAKPPEKPEENSDGSIEFTPSKK